MGTINFSSNYCTWRVSAQKDILKLIEFFNKYPLNTSKQLNFLDWQKAFYLYISLKNKNLNIEEKEKIKVQILELKAGLEAAASLRGAAAPKFRATAPIGSCSFRLCIVRF